MLTGWVSALVILAGSALVGRAATRLAGEDRWTGLEPAAGFAVIAGFEAILARISPDRSVLALGMITLAVLAAAILSRPGRIGRPELSPGLLTTLGVVFLLLNLPFLFAGNWGVPGLTDGVFVSFDLGAAGAPSHVVILGIDGGVGILGPSVFTGLLMATVLVFAWTAWEAVDRLDGWKRSLAGVLVALPYLVVSAYAAAAFTQLAATLFLLAFLVAVDRMISSRPAKSVFRSVLLPGILTVGSILTLAFAGNVPGGILAGGVSPAAGLGVWLNPDYGPAAAGETPLPGFLAAVGGLALVVSLWWWSREPRSAWPIGLLGCAATWILALLVAGDDVSGQVLAVASPVVMVVVLTALLTGPRSGWKPQQGMEFGGWMSLTALFVVGAIASSLLVLKETPVVSPGQTRPEAAPAGKRPTPSSPSVTRPDRP
ncbi:MAG: hypothetical protein M9938_01845 [Solirubrobacterales bacterium]|nr:hypothetical protein [Solirubrobacterales bacterium]